uniref:Uncharacterized protein n=1 Tax=Arundo donax TaxID=35708 RepID=A0A0A9CG42_ARUDO
MASVISTQRNTLRITSVPGKVCFSWKLRMMVQQKTWRSSAYPYMPSPASTWPAL